MSLRRFITPLWKSLSSPILSTKSSALSALSQSRGFASKKHKLLLKHAKGYRGRAKNCFTIAIRRVHKAWQYAYRDRRQQKRMWRKLWIQRVGAGFRQHGWSYSRAIHQLPQHQIHLNRKTLSELASNEPFAFKAIVDVLNHHHHQPQQQPQKEEAKETK